MQKKWLPVLISLALMTGCSTTDIKVDSTVSVPQQFDRTINAKTMADISRWWQNWSDPVLQDLIATGL